MMNLIYTYSCKDLQGTRTFMNMQSLKEGNFTQQLALGIWSVVNQMIEGYSW